MFWVVCYILLTHEEGSHREVYQDFQPTLTTFVGDAKSYLDHSFRATSAYS